MKARLSWLEWLLRLVLKYISTDAQQGSTATTHAATALELGVVDGPKRMAGRLEVEVEKYVHRMWEEIPMPQARHPKGRREIWEFADGELNI
jgi:hypothetical protein